MLSGLYTSANAMSAFQTSLDNTANNLANVNTTSFKRNVVGFEDLTYTGNPGYQVGNGVRIGSITPRGFAQGTLTTTGNPTDVAITGTGFLIVQLPDGSTQYTRDGSLSISGTGQLVTSEGYIVQPAITIPANTISTSIGSDGTVTVLTSSAPNTPKTLGQIQLASFINQEGLYQQPNNLYSQSAASGPPTIGTPGTNNLGTLQSGSLEQSNVDVTTELTNLVTTQQAYTANSKVIGTTNQMVGSALSIVT
jgi:flagellar basal-body rod protein FlgG